MRTGVAAILLAGLLALAGGAAAASAPRADMFWASATGAGGDFRLSTVADDGAAAGTLILVDKNNRFSHAIYYKGTGTAFTDLNKKVGAGSVAVAINDRHQVVGFGSADTNPTAYDLLNPKVDTAHKPHAFLYSGGKVKRLAQPSIATDVNDAGIVVGNFLANGQLHAFAWFTGGLRWSPVASSRFIDLGGGTANAITNPTTSSKVAIGGSVGTSAGYFSLDAATGKFTSKALPFVGEVTTLDAAWGGAGYSRPSLTDVTQVPVLVNLQKATQTPVSIPAPYTSAQLNAVNDAGVAYGDLFGADNTQGGSKWVGRAPQNPAAAFPTAALHGRTITGVTAASLGGLFTGTGTFKNDPWTFIAYPAPADQLASVRAGVTLTGAAAYARGTSSGLGKAGAVARAGKTAAACTAVGKVRDANNKDSRKTGFYVRGNLIQALDEVQSLLGCSKIVPARGMPFHR